MVYCHTVNWVEKFSIVKAILSEYCKAAYMEQTTLSKYVKAMRKQYNLTEVELSEKSGVGLRLVRELEQGKQTLRLDKVNQILNLFGSEVGVVPMTKTDER